MALPPTAIARAILAHRSLRRQVLFWLTLGTMAACGLGWFGLAWMQDRPLLMLVWWGGVAVLTLGILGLALFDLLVVAKEIRAEDEDR